MKTWKGSCRARCAATGRQCCLPDGHTSAHATPRGAFLAVAQPGQTTFAHRDAVDRAASSGGKGESMYETQSEAQYVRDLRRRRKVEAKNRAHSGEATTLNHERANR